MTQEGFGAVDSLEKRKDGFLVELRILVATRES